MKVFFKKLKRAKKSSVNIFYIYLGIYILSYIIFAYNLFKLQGIEDFLRYWLIIFFFVFGLYYFFMLPYTLFAKKKKSRYFLNTLTTIFIVVFIIGSIGISYLYGALSEFNKSHVSYTTNLIVMKDTTLSKDSVVGMIDNKDDIEGHILANDLIKKESIDNEIVLYNDYLKMIEDLYNGEIDGMFVSSNYPVIFGDTDVYGNVVEKVKVIHKLTEIRKNEDHDLTSNKSLDEPFSILLMGVDSELDGLTANQAFNGDTLMLVTIDPTTFDASIFSVPRDTYVPIACRNGAKNKINSSAAYGTKCVIDTMEDLVDVPIDYYVKVNFKAVVDFVEAIGGITVDVEEPNFNINHGVNCGGKICEQDSKRRWGKHTVYIEPGVQKLDGEQALAYSRCRGLYLESDIARNRHQQDVVSAMVKSLANLRSFNDFNDILDAVSSNIETNIKPKKMFELYDAGKEILLSNEDIADTVSIQKTYLEVYDLPIVMPGTSFVASALGYYEGSLNEISKHLRANLGLEDKEMNKSFSINYNDDYSGKVIGAGIREGNVIKTLPNFIGKSLNEAQTWAANNGVTFYYDYMDGNGSANTIGKQSISAGTDLSKVKTLTVHIYKEGSISSTEDDEDITE